MSRTRKRLLILAVIVITALSMMFIFGKNQVVTEALKYLLYPYDVLSSAISSVSAKFGGLIDAAEENKKLRADLLAEQIEKQGYSEIIAESRRLHELLNLRTQIESGGTAVHVVGRGYDKFANTLVIDKGQNQGIVKDMPVITSKGLAGKVLSVRKDFSDIILLTDWNFSVAVRLKDSRHEGVLTGSGRGRCILKYVPVEEAVKEGEIVITSGLDGIFQPGIPVGRVIKVQTEGVEFFQYIEVAPFQQPYTIEEAMVISRSAVFKGMHASDADPAESIVR
jgi:rod shape-determining protein MreC